VLSMGQPGVRTHPPLGLDCDVEVPLGVVEAA
jgi:hypothetical protein